MNSQHLYTDSGNVLYDVLLPLCDILIFMGATRMLSFKSTPNTASGFPGRESCIHGICWKNLEAMLVSARLGDADGRVGDVGDAGPGVKRLPGWVGPGVLSWAGVNDRLSRHSSSSGPRLREKRLIDFRGPLAWLGRHSLELIDPLPNELTLCDGRELSTERNACLSTWVELDSPSPVSKDTSVGVSMETPSVFTSSSSSSSGMLSGTFGRDSSDTTDLMAILGTRS
jgi:hypothetical protein